MGKGSFNFCKREDLLTSVRETARELANFSSGGVLGALLN